MKKSPLVLILALCSFGFLVVMGIAAVTVLGGRGTSSSGAEPKLFSKGTRIGVLEVNGVISDSKKLLEQVSQFEEDTSIKGVVVRINSPGGAVAPSQEIYDGLKRLSAKKPVFSSMGSVAASGGYYIACGTQKIFADAGTITGSIGVIMQFINLSKLYEWAKVAPYNIKTGKFKDLGSPDREMSAEEKAVLQEMIDNVLMQFRRAVAESRKLPIEKVIELSDGRIFSGEQAKEHNLVDALGGLHDAATAMVAEVKGDGKPIYVYPSKKRKLLIEKLFEEDEGGWAEEQTTAASGKVAALVKLAKAFLVLSGDADGANALGSAAQQQQMGLMYLLPMGR